MSEEIMITQQDLVDWIDRPPSNDDLDLATFIATRLEKFYDLEHQLQQKENIIKEVREWAKKCSCQFTNDDGELVVSEISFNIQARPCDLFKILDEENNK